MARKMMPVFVKEFQIGEHWIRIEQEGQVGIGGMVWEPSLTLSKFIHKNQEKVFEGVGNVIELGAGTGLCGLASANINPSVSVTLTDLKRQLSLMEANMRINEVSNVDVKEYDWCKRPNIGKFDMVLCSDLIYDPDLFEDLLESIAAVTRDTSKVFVCNELRQASNRDFIVKAIEHGWTVTRVPAYLYGDEFNEETIIFRLYKGL